MRQVPGFVLSVLRWLLRTSVLIIGVSYLVTIISFFFGSGLLLPAASVLPLIVSDIAATRILRMLELLLHFYFAVIVFRYLTRFFPVSCVAGVGKISREPSFFKLRDGERGRSENCPVRVGDIRDAFQMLLLLIVSTYYAAMGLFSPRSSHFILPLAIYAATIVFLMYRRYGRVDSEVYSGSILFLRRFSTFSDRSLIGTVFRAAPRGGNVTFLIPRDEPSANWDPLLLGIAGFEPLHPMTSIPLYLRSSDAQWTDHVARLINEARCVVVDVSVPSPSVLVEMQLLRENHMLDKAVFMARDTADIDNISNQLAGIFPSDAESVRCRIINYECSWLQTVLRGCLSTLLILMAGVFASVLFGPLVGISAGSKLEVGYMYYMVALPFYALITLGIALVWRDVVLKMSLSRKSANDIVRQIRRVLDRSESKFSTFCYVSELIDLLFGAAAGALAVGFVFAAFGYSDFSLENWIGQASSGQYYPERAADYGQLGAFLGALVGGCYGLLSNHDEGRRYRIKRAIAFGVAAASIGTAILSTAIGITYFYVYDGQRESFANAIAQNSEAAWMLPMSVLLCGLMAAQCGGERDSSRDNQPWT